MRVSEFTGVLKAAASGWIDDNAMRLSAALAYYAIFSLVPLLVIVVSIAGLIFGSDAARGRLVNEMVTLAGPQAAEAIQGLIMGASRKSASLSATMIGLAVLFFGASGVFGELKSALNTIWGVQTKPGRPIRTMLRDRVISFCMVLSTGLLLILSLLASAAIAALGELKLFTLPEFVWHTVDLGLSVIVVTVLFAMILKALPNVILHWQDVWVGAACTAFLFTLGKFLIGVYLGKSGVTSYYGAAGSAILILLWVYYSACIFFFGAEFTKAYVQLYRREIQPDSRAVRIRPLSEPAAPQVKTS